MSGVARGGIEVEWVNDGLERVARAYRDGDKILRRAITKSLRDVAKPLGEAIIREGAEGLPHSGGLSATIRDNGRVTVTASLTGSSPKVTIGLSNRQGIQMASLDKGSLRHPVYGHRSAWVLQSIRAHLFTDAFTSSPQVARVQAAALEAMEATVRDIARLA